MFRLLPYLIIFLAVNFVVRTLNLVTDNAGLFITELQAEDEAKKKDNSGKKNDAKKEAEPEKKPDSADSSQEEVPTPNTRSGQGERKEDHLEPKDDERKPGEKHKDPITTSDEGWTPVISDNENVKMNFSDDEIRLLQDLVTRRQQLDKREKDVSFKENSLLMMNQNIDSKIKTLGTLQEKVASVLQEYEKRENQKIAGLVKIYENMKPKDAARIFDELQMSILIDVAESMKEAKLAPIIAQMNSEKAKELTVAIASRRRL